MSPKTRGKSSTGWKPPRDRREIVVAVLASLTIIVITTALLWFLRPNRDSGSTVTDTTVATTTAPVPATTTAAAPVTTSSTP
jgi:hypothetical protein